VRGLERRDPMDEAMEPMRKEILRSLPSAEELFQKTLAQRAGNLPKRALLEAAKEVLNEARAAVIKCPEEELETLPRSRAQWLERLSGEVSRTVSWGLRPLINATGVIVHTNLGRSPLAPRAVEAIGKIASRYSDLEYDLREGKRGSRQSHIEGLLRRLTGAEAAAIVNNNAAAVLLSLSALAKGREVIVSRGELVEIGGSFRMPEVMAQSGAHLVEVGTTNKTRPRDYERALTERTALLLKVHTSNYRIVGFSQEVSLEELVEIGRRASIPVMYDLGSGCLVDLRTYVDEGEPTVQEALEKGADIVTFSGDKLLGGPQAGIILGRKDLLDLIKAHPLARAVRIDKLTLAAMVATLELYWEPREAMDSIPTLRMIRAQSGELKSKARALVRSIRKEAPGISAGLREDHSKVGGGAMPLAKLPTWVVALKSEEMGAHELAKALRGWDPPIIARVYQDEVILDVRTMEKGDIPIVAKALGSIAMGEEARGRI
jgi:L-seryl-tRNA(Ser) seleniumtransferase